MDNEAEIIKGRCKLINDHFQNFKSYGIPHAQLIIADPPYNLGKNAYASNPAWYKDGDNRNGESELAGKEFFDTDKDFRPAEFMHFCSQMLVKEPKQGVTDKDVEEGMDGGNAADGTGKRRKSTAPCMILFCAFEQLQYYIDLGKRYGFMHFIPLVFRKDFSAQVLKANMKVVGNCEYGLILYKNKLPKFNNDGQMVFNCFDWVRDTTTPKTHPCLPAGQKVYINNHWMDIEDVKVGDKSSYGEVVETTEHDASKIVTISTENGETKATYNHPFLILRGNEIAWCEAEQLNTNDYILWLTGVKKHQNQQKKGTYDSNMTRNPEWNTSLSGNDTLEQCLKGTKSITSTETKQTIELKISSLSLPLNTSGYTKVANLFVENGTSRVVYAENTNLAQSNTGISAEEQSVDEFARNAILPKLLQQERFSLQKVGSVRITEERTRVYNLTISGVPAFDTEVGVSHNTQKPVPLLERLIEIFTDPDDVVIDPCAGSGSTLRAAIQTGRKAYGFEIKKDFFVSARDKVLKRFEMSLFK